MEFIFVGKVGSVLPDNYTLFEGGFDEVGLENFALHLPQCSGSKNVVLYNFCVKSAIKFAFPSCDCLPSKVYVLFDTEEKIEEFLSILPTHKKMYVKRV